jgi:hypothetical protein
MHLTHKFLPSSILWVLILLFVRETKSKTLEELDQVFAIPTEVHAAYGLRQIPYGVRKWILCQPVEAVQLYQMDDSISDDFDNNHHQGKLSNEV